MKPAAVLALFLAAATAAPLAPVPSSEEAAAAAGLDRILRREPAMGINSAPKSGVNNEAVEEAADAVTPVL